jgi:tetratricopeptide (TPR) repeat protein
MPELIPFIGRNTELDKLKEAIDARGDRRVVCIHGEGGIGKTRLLQEVRERYAQDAFMTDIIDFDDLALRVPANIEFTIAKQIGGEMFDNYLQSLRAYHQIRRTEPSSERLTKKKQEIHQIFVAGFNEFSAKQRVVLLLDTTDTLEGTEAWNYIVTKLSQRLENLVLIVAGRNAQEIYQELKSQIGPNAYSIKLRPLNQRMSRSYLRQKQDLLHITLTPERAKRLLQLAKGRPILIDLAVEWLAREIETDWESDFMNVEALPDNETVRRPEEFESRLVRHIAQIRTSMDRLTLAMSHVYPLNVDMITELLKISKSEAKELFEEASSYVFVKSLPDIESLSGSRISLHDEMRRMVNKYVWPEVGEQRRRWYSELAVTCLDHTAQTLQAQIDRAESEEPKVPLQQEAVVDPLSRREVLKQLLWTIKVRILRHRMYLDPTRGFEEFDQLFQNAFHERESDLCIMLRETVEAYSDRLTEENLIKLSLNQGKIDILKGDFKTAMLGIRSSLERLMNLDPNRGFVEFDWLFQDIFNRGNLHFCTMLRKVVEKHHSDLSEENQVRLGVSKGLIDVLEGDLESAVNCISTELERLRQLKVTENLDRIYNSLGYCYRLQGNWDLAIDSYEQALYYSHLEQDARQIAETMNNVANVRHLKGDYGGGLCYTKTGLEIREKLGAKPSIANSCYMHAIILWAMGSVSEAATYLKRASELYQELEDPVRIAWVDRQLGYFYYCIGDIDTAVEHLKKATSTFREHGFKSDWADALNMLSVAIRRSNITGRTQEAIFREAEKYALEGVEIAQEIGDNYKIAKCNLTLCILYYRWGGEYHQTREHREQILKYYNLALERYNEGFPIARDGNYIDLLAAYCMTAGNVAYDEGFLAYDSKDETLARRKWDEALGHYLDECRFSIAYKKTRFDRALGGMATRLMKLPTPTLTQEFCDKLIDQWVKRGLDQQYLHLVVAECEQIKLFLDIPEAAAVSELSQAQIDSLAMGNWQQVLEAGQQVLEHNRIYLHNLAVVHALNRSAFALRQLGRFSEAWRLCTQSLHIGEKLYLESQVKAGKPEGEQDKRINRAQAAFAESHYVMGQIHWIAGNTVQAQPNLRTARELFKDSGDVVGAARATRYEGVLYFYVGDLEKSLELLEEARSCFETHGQSVDLAQVLVMESRVLAEVGQYEQARQKVERANKIACQAGSNYVIAETLINLYKLHFREGQVTQESGDRQASTRHFDLAQQYLREGTEIVYRFGYDLLISVYEQMAGDIAFDEGRLGQAFGHYVTALEHGVAFDYARLHRTLDPCIDRVVQLPADLIRYYADYVIREWKTRGLDTEFPDVVNMFELIKEYREYVSQA